MGTDTEGLLNKLPTVTAYLCSEAGVHSNDLMTGTCSLIFKDSEERTPTGIHDALRQVMVLDHVRDLKVLNSNTLIPFCIGLGCLEMMVAALPIDLEMRFGSVLGSFTASMRIFLAPTQLPLLAPECFLRGAIEARVLNRMAFTIGQEGLQPHIDANIRVLTCGGQMVVLWFRFADDERIPVSISPEYQVHRLGLALDLPMQLDLEEVAELLGDDEMFLVFMQVHIFAVLPQLDRVPAVRFLEAGKAHTRNGVLFGGKEAFEGLGETIGQHLDGGGRNMFTLSLESGFQIILAWERACFLILSPDSLKHLVIDDARLSQALHEQMGLLLLRIQAILKCSHASILLQSRRIVKRGRCALRRRPFTPVAESRGPQAALG